LAQRCLTRQASTAPSKSRPTTNPALREVSETSGDEPTLLLANSRPFAPAAKGYAVTIDAIRPDGQPQKWGYTSSFDGSENPVSGNPNIDTIVARTRTGTVEYMKAGKVVSTTTSVMSDVDKTLTVTVKSLNAQGNEVTTIAVYDRQ
jgi:hypothetical protein